MKRFNLDEFKKNPTRNVVTRNGLPVRILCTDAKSKSPVVALIEDNGEEHLFSYNQDGAWSKKHKGEVDLFFAPEKRESWVNMYRNERGRIFFGRPYYTKEEALDELYDDKDTRIYTTKVEWEE